MSNEVALSVEGMSLAEAMGVNTSTSSTTSTLARLAQIQAPIMDADDENVMIPLGAYRLTVDGEQVYAKDVNFRLFAQREQWTKWDSQENRTQRTLMAQKLNADLKDTMGTFNLGRPTGYVKDFNALPEATKTLMREIRRTKVVFGLVQLVSATDENKVPVSGYDGWVPCVIDVKNKDSIKEIEGVLNAISMKKKLPPEYAMELTSKRSSLPNGNKYATIQAKLGKETPYDPSVDQQYLTNFMDYISWSNNYILEKWDEKNVKQADVSEDALMQIIDGDEL